MPEIITREPNIADAERLRAEAKPTKAATGRLHTLHEVAAAIGCTHEKVKDHDAFSDLPGYRRVAEPIIGRFADLQVKPWTKNHLVDGSMLTLNDAATQFGLTAEGVRAAVTNGSLPGYEFVDAAYVADATPRTRRA